LQYYRALCRSGGNAFLPAGFRLHKALPFTAISCFAADCGSGENCGAQFYLKKSFSVFFSINESD
jgi:hypothetical protein